MQERDTVDTYVSVIRDGALERQAVGVGTPPDSRARLIALHLTRLCATQHGTIRLHQSNDHERPQLHDITVILAPHQIFRHLHR